MLNNPEAGALESVLYGAAPDLPSNLKSKTLAGCAQRVAAQQARERRLHRAWTAGVMTVLCLQLFTVQMLDAQNARIMSGEKPSPSFASITLPQLAKVVHDRSLQIASLTAPFRWG